MRTLNCLLLLLPTIAFAASIEAPPPFVLAQSTILVTRTEGLLQHADYNTNVYDSRGREIESITASDTDGDGTIDQRTTVRWSYDSRGNRTNAVGETVLLAVGSVLSRFASTIKYDGHDNITNIVDHMDTNDDGITDLEGVFDYTYDVRGHIITMVSTWHSELYPAFDSSTTETRTYNQRGDIVLSVAETKYPQDPNYPLSGVTLTRWAYNARGEPLSMVTETDLDADGVPEGGTFERTFVCDQRGLHVQAFDRAFAEDGTLVATMAAAYSWDQHRHVTQVREEYDDNADGVIDRYVVVNDTYVHR